VHLCDHSSRASAFAARKVQEEFPDVEVRTDPPAGAPDLLLVSHVLAELGTDEEEALLAVAGEARSVLWVEPGNRSTSGRLGAVRARLIDRHEVVAPCPHQGPCGALEGGRGTAWCHFFARPAGEVFTEGRWAELGRELGIDLRALPYSFLALRQRLGEPLAAPARCRLLGRPRLTRGRAQLDVCDEHGVRVLDFLQRNDRALFRNLGESPPGPGRFDAEIEGSRITELRPR
jgi:ribosomal protein RSM22 (predicted rRNA methylase)